MFSTQGPNNTRKGDQFISPGDLSIKGCRHSVFCLGYGLALRVRALENTETNVDQPPEGRVVRIPDSVSTAAQKEKSLLQKCRKLPERHGSEIRERPPSGTFRHFLAAKEVRQRDVGG